VERRVWDVNRLLRRRLEGGMGIGESERLERLLVPFMPAGMRRLYDTASAHDGSEESRKSAREGFESFFEPWLSSFEDLGVRVKACQLGGRRAGWRILCLLLTTPRMMKWAMAK
jgi:hypothetical protein